MRCLLPLERSSCSWLCNSQPAILPPRSSRKHHLHFRHKSRWFFCLKKELPGKIAALLAGKEPSVFNLVVVGFQVRGYLTLGIGSWWESCSEPVHLNFYRYFSKESLKANINKKSRRAKKLSKKNWKIKVLYQKKILSKEKIDSFSAII